MAHRHTNRASHSGERNGIYRVSAIALLSSLMLVLSPASANAELEGACPSNLKAPGYPDVDSDSVHAQAIGCIAWWEITLGTGFGTFDPEGSVKRDQMASFVARLVQRLGGELPRYSYANQYGAARSDKPHRASRNRIAEEGL